MNALRLALKYCQVKEKDPAVGISNNNYPGGMITDSFMVLFCQGIKLFFGNYNWVIGACSGNINYQGSRILIFRTRGCNLTSKKIFTTDDTVFCR